MMTTDWFFVHFGLLVTGETEKEHLPKLFKTLTALGICHFEVISKINQRSPLTSPKKQLKMIGSGKKIPNKDVTDIGIPARQYVSKSNHHYVILIDDLEHDRRDQIEGIFERYRKSLDTILKDNKSKASVHFLVYMLEAYYFADSHAINKVLETSLTDYDGDVETIRHPKNELKKIHSTFREKDDGGKILQNLNLEKVLGNPNTCASLRTLFAWCFKILAKHPYPDQNSFDQLKDSYCINSGKTNPTTESQ